MESVTPFNANGTKLPSSPPGIPIDPLLLAWVPPASVPSGPAPTTATTGSLISPTAVVPPNSLQSTLPDHHYQRISSPAPAHGLPVVSAAQEQHILTTLSLPSALQLDVAISPFAYLAAMPTAAEVVQICDVPESLYGRVKLEMYPIQVQRRAVMRMWRAFHWNWDNETDVKKFVSKELSKRYHQSKRAADKKMAKLATRDVANAAVERAATTLPNAQAALAVTTNNHPDSELDVAVCPADGAATATPSGSSGSFPAATSPVAAWSDPDVHLARAFLGDAYWNAVDYAIADDESGAFGNWGEVPAIGVLLQDWMLNTEFLDHEDFMLEEMEDEH
ncbi:hypothetical protein FPQ18DRAFT_309045 [Pyronema domesticum]|uniref:Uncharacterized protein n=1 Tax=Pyronema omphalodes (strain CBS 100304) TaxID=1076935 RepID=U4KY90_PYROM|nr:hypothetical protein FPQ18DRAFT_309045 [Pyronema domesticum]CCX04564.1 Protein of unknown function [Pyronema omphalodes CBS 100304]